MGIKYTGLIKLSFPRLWIIGIAFSAHLQFCGTVQLQVCFEISVSMITYPKDK